MNDVKESNSNCNECGKKFKNKEAINVDVQNNNEYLMLICPHCKTVFPISISDKKIKARLKKIESIRLNINKEIKSKKVNRNNYEMLIQKHDELIHQNLADNKELMQKYKESFNKYGKVFKSE